MKQVAMDGATPFLSVDIITNILKRLPVKSLIRFRCVCKNWQNLLKTPSFIAAHLQNSSNQNHFPLSVRHDGDYVLFDFLDCMMQHLEVQNAPVIKWTRDGIVGSCSGLLCFSIDEFGISPPSFILWNPATREVRHVPRPVTDFHGRFFIGFGFSPIVNDYKIVINYGTQVKRVGVYSLNTGLWKELEFGNLEGASLPGQATTVNGVIFWLGFVKGQDGDKDTPVIVSFDIAREEFTVIPRPALDSPALDPISIPSLTVCENKLAFLVRTASRDSEYSSIDVWVLNEDIEATREMWNWTKKYTSNSYPCYLLPLTIWRSEVVCYAYVKPEPTTLLYLLNLATNECKMFPVGIEDVDIFNYIESLVPLNNRHIEEP